MSYQYPPPPNGARLDMSQVGYAPTYNLPPQHPPSMVSTGSNGSPVVAGDQEDSDMLLQRTYSTPDSRAHQQSAQEAQQQIQASAAMDRRRNKLGYHRTSVACGHCRRRKIRCIPSSSDTQGRCVNCIRLKKECSFYPVDQPPPNEPRVKSSRPSAGPKVKSASSSPVTPSGIPGEMPAHQTFPPTSVAGAPNMATSVGNNLGNETFNVEMNGIGTGATHSHDFSGQSVSNWVPTDSCPSPGARSVESGTNWRAFPSESPLSANFSPYTQAPPSSATWSSSESSSRDDIGWGHYPAPVRSMSYSGEPFGTHHSTYPTMAPIRSFDRRPSHISDVYSSSMAMSSVETAPSPALDPAMSMSAGSGPPPGFETWAHHHQNHHHYTYPRPEEGHPGWHYGESREASSTFTTEPTHRFVKNT